jgi:hypothetical protein
MSSFDEIPEVVGFFSYSREDDADSQGALSALRSRIQGELRGQLGRTAKTFHLWQDKEAIPSGTLWESEIRNAVAQSVFFIPIITPTVVASRYCRFELESFLARETALGRDDLVFPILYIDVPALEDSVRSRNDPVLSLIAQRQYVDWREFRYLDVNSTDVKREVGRFCTHIRDALCRTWLSPEERKQQEEAAARQKAEAERQRQEAEAKRRSEELVRQRAAEEDRRKREAEVEQRRQAQAEAMRLSVEADAGQKRAEAEHRRKETAHQEAQSERILVKERRGDHLQQPDHTLPRSKLRPIAFFLVGVGVALMLFDILVPARWLQYRPFMIALPLFALGAASILSGLALVGTEVRKSNQQGGETKWTLLDATAAVLVLGGMFGLWLLGSFLAMDQTLATNSWLLGKAPLDATMVIFGAKILAGSRRLVHEPLLAAVCVAGIALYVGDLWSYWGLSDEYNTIYRLLDAIGMLVNLTAVTLLAFSYFQRRSANPKP